MIEMHWEIIDLVFVVACIFFIGFLAGWLIYKQKAKKTEKKYLGIPIQRIEDGKVYYRESIPKTYVKLLRQDENIPRVHNLIGMNLDKLPEVFFVKDWLKWEIIPFRPVPDLFDFKLGEGPPEEEDKEIIELEEAAGRY